MTHNATLPHPSPANHTAAVMPQSKSVTLGAAPLPSCATMPTLPPKPLGAVKSRVLDTHNHPTPSLFHGPLPQPPPQVEERNRKTQRRPTPILSSHPNPGMQNSRWCTALYPGGPRTH